jgi:biopolymer transport protein ExbD
MRIPGQHHREPALEGEAMTPMIDVVFLLLVFFVCASVGQIPDALLPAELAEGNTSTEVEIPPSEILDEPEHQEVRIGLRPGPQLGSVIIELNKATIPTAAELRSRLVQLAEIDPQTRIILDIDDDASVQQFIRIYDLCQALGFEDISFAV